MKIILIGEKYSSNLGDGVIFDTVEKICSDIYENVEFIALDISGGTFYNQNRNLTVAKIKLLFPRLRRLLSKRKRKILLKKRLKKIDIRDVGGAIFVGGQLFIEYFSEQILTIGKFLNKNNIPTIYNSCGLGKSFSKKSIKMLKTALKLPNVKAISLRDNLDLFKLLYGEDIKVLKALDPVAELGKYFESKSCETKVGIGLIEPRLFLHNKINFSYHDYNRLIKIIVESLEKRKVKWEFFCNGSEDDYNFINEVCEKNKIEKRISQRPTSPDALIETISSYSTIISFRLHSHIIGVSLKKNIIGFNWDNKVKEFSKTINSEQYFLDLNEDVFKNIEKIISSYNFTLGANNYHYDEAIISSREFLLRNKFKEM